MFSRRLQQKQFIATLLRVAKTCVEGCKPRLPQLVAPGLVNFSNLVD